MADGNDLFFFGDDFDAILSILEEEEELDEQFREAADEVSIKFILSHPELIEKRCFDVYLHFNRVSLSKPLVLQLNPYNYVS